MAGQEEPARGPGPAPLCWKEMQARPLARVICHSALRPVGRRLAVIGSAQARNVTREKSEWGPQQQVVILGVRRREFCFPVPASRAARCFPPLRPASQERRAGLPRGWGPALTPVPAELPRSIAGRRTGGFRETSAAMSPRD